MTQRLPEPRAEELASRLGLTGSQLETELRPADEPPGCWLRLVISTRTEAPTRFVLRLFPIDPAAPRRCWISAGPVGMTYDSLDDGTSPFRDERCQPLLHDIERRFREGSEASTFAELAAFLLRAEAPPPPDRRPRKPRTPRTRAPRTKAPPPRAPRTVMPVEGAPAHEEHDEDDHDDAESLPRWRGAVGAYHECTLSGAEEDILELAVQHRLIAALLEHGPVTPSELARRTDTDADFLGPLLDVIAQLGLVSLENGRVRIDASFDPPQLMLAAFEARWQLRDAMRAQLPAALSGGRDAAMAVTDPIAEDLWRATNVLMGATQRLNFDKMKAMVRRLDLGDARRLLDIGAGSGHYASAMASVHEDLSVTAVDYPVVGDLLRASLERQGMADRVQVVEAPFFDAQWAPPPGHDTIFLANTIHVAGPEAVAGLLVRLRDALVEGGRLIVHERLQLASEPEGDEQDTRERLVNGMNALNWFVGEGRAYSAEHIERLLRDCGFTKIDTSPPQGGIGVFVAWKRAAS